MKADYGFDAPHVVRNLLLFSAIAFLLAALSFFIDRLLWFWLAFLYAFSTALSLFATGCWMLYGIRIAKPIIARRLIQDLRLQGHEQVLDLGCGRGLFLIEAAKRLPHGKGYGLDLWQQKDQSGNSREQTLENAKAEGVCERVELHTGDMRSLPFSDSAFDAIVSCLAIHNIPDEAGREQAIKEMLRVLKPKGQFALLDILHTSEYFRILSRECGVVVNCSKPIYRYLPPIRIIQGAKQ